MRGNVSSKLDSRKFQKVRIIFQNLFLKLDENKDIKKCRENNGILLSFIETDRLKISTRLVEIVAFLFTNNASDIS